MQNGNAIAPPSLNVERPLADRTLYGSQNAGRAAPAAIMEVDRVSRMGGLGGDGAPSWTRDKMQRRRYVEEVPSEDEQEEAVQAVETDEDRNGLLDLMA